MKNSFAIIIVAAFALSACKAEKAKPQKPKVVKRAKKKVVKKDDLQVETWTRKDKEHFKKMIGFTLNTLLADRYSRREGKPKKAVKHLDKAIAILATMDHNWKLWNSVGIRKEFDASDSGTIGQVQAMTRLKRGFILTSLGKYEKALDDFWWIYNNGHVKHTIKKFKGKFWEVKFLNKSLGHLPRYQDLVRKLTAVSLKEVSLKEVLQAAKKATKPVASKPKQAKPVKKLTTAYLLETLKLVVLTRKAKECAQKKDYTCVKKRLTVLIKLIQKHKLHEQCSSERTCGEYLALLRLNRAFFSLKMKQKSKALADLEWIQRHKYTFFLFGEMPHSAVWEYFDIVLGKNRRYKKLLAKERKKLLKMVRKTLKDMKKDQKELNKPKK